MSDEENFKRIMEGLEEIVEIVEGRAEPPRAYVPGDIDVKAIRGRTGAV